MDDKEDSSSRSSSVDLTKLGVRPRAATRDTVIGKIRPLSDLERIEVAFLIVSFLALSTCIVLTCLRMPFVDDSDFIFSILVLCNSVYCIYYIIHGVFKERPYELGVFIIAVVIIMIYILVNYIVTDGWKQKIKVVRLVLTLVFGFIIVIMAGRLVKNYIESGNLVFRTVGANTELQTMCKTMFFFSGLLKLDFQLETSMVILILTGPTNLSHLEIIVLSVGIPFSIIWLILGFFTFRYEKKWMAYVFWVTAIFEPVYIGYRMYLEASRDGGPSSLADVSYACAALALIVRIVLVIAMGFVYRNFDKGLKEKVYCKSTDRRDTNVESVGDANDTAT